LYIWQALIARVVRSPFPSHIMKVDNSFAAKQDNSIFGNRSKSWCFHDRYRRRMSELFT